jgi:hypothetical protein
MSEISFKHSLLTLDPDAYADADATFVAASADKLLIVDR